MATISASESTAEKLRARVSGIIKPENISGVTFFRNVTFVMLVSVNVILVSFAPLAFASPLSDARAAGLVVELADGYVQAKSKKTAVINLVTDINTRRQAAYARIAKKNKIPIAKVAAESYLKRTSDGKPR
ncbi:MAG: YdbL family protein [Pseudomonadales bacterium]|nr:YdbL family protein [Pseudomonadales bacterium]